MYAPTSPADLYCHGARLLLDKDITARVALRAEGAVMEFPSTPDDRPWRLDGKEAVAARMRSRPDRVGRHDFPDLRIDQATGPEGAAVETRGVGRPVRNDQPFDMACIGVMTVKGGTGAYRDCRNTPAVLEPGAEFMGGSR
ncbi:nuclear transport factor 2 family protein [Streptomyces sp. NPDC001500]